MKKVLASITLTLIMFSALMLVGSASADHNPSGSNPAESKYKCTAEGGKFSKSGSTNTCVITLQKSTTKTVAATSPGWKVTVKKPELTEKYTFQTSRYDYGKGTHTITSSSGTRKAMVIACYDPQGKSVPDFAINPNCKPAMVYGH